MDNSTQQSLIEQSPTPDEIEQLLILGFKLVDTREPNREPDRTMRYELLKTGWRQHRMNYGDYAFLSHDKLKVGFTRKTWADLLGSMNDIFAKQLDEMLDYYDTNIFVLEETMQWDELTDKIIHPGSRYTREHALNWLHRWLAKGFILEKSPSWQYTVKRLNELYALYGKEFSMSAKSKKWVDERNLAFPPSTRGKTSQACLNELGSIVSVGNAGKERLQQIDGVGPKKAEMIRWWLNLDRRTQDASNRP